MPLTCLSCFVFTGVYSNRWSCGSWSTAPGVLHPAEANCSCPGLQDDTRCNNLPTRLRLCIQDVLEDREDTPDQIDGWLQDQ